MYGYNNSYIPNFNNRFNNQNTYSQSIPKNTYDQSSALPTNVNWVYVNGIDGARNHMVQPNQTIWLMDNNDKKFYVKSADIFGVTTLRAYNFTEIDFNAQNRDSFDTSDINLSDYVKKSEIEEIIETKLNEIVEQSLKGGKNND